MSSPPVSWEQGRTEPPVQLALDGGDVAAVGDQGDEDGVVEVEGEIIAAVEVEAKALSAKRAFKICPVCDQKIDKRSFHRHHLSHEEKKASFRCHACGEDFTLAASLKTQRWKMSQVSVFFLS